MLNAAFESSVVVVSVVAVPVRVVAPPVRVVAPPVRVVSSPPPPPTGRYAPS